MAILATTDPETIRQALAARLEAIAPRLDWRDGARWTFTDGAEVSGTLRNFDLIFAPEVEVIVTDDGGQGGYGGVIEYECDVSLVVSYPVKLAELPRFLGSDLQDLTGILVKLHQTATGMKAMHFSQDRRVVPSYTGTEPNFIGTFAFKISFFAPDEPTEAA
jgi:hypothetical protein